MQQEEGAVARRTRSRLEAYYRNIHRSIKNPTNNNAKDEEQIISNHQVDKDKDKDKDVISINSECECECDDEEEKKEQQMIKKKKKQRGGDLLERDIDRESFINAGGGGVVRGLLPLKFKLDDGDEEEREGEKSEIDRLFDELEVALWESHHHSNSNSNSNCVGVHVMSPSSFLINYIYIYIYIVG